MKETFVLAAAMFFMFAVSLAAAEEANPFSWHVSVRLDGQPIVTGVFVTARPGRLLGILGPSGAGKTTVLHALAGALPGSRRIRMDGSMSEGVPTIDDGSVVLMRQDDSFFGMLTVRETLEAAAELQPVPGVEPRPRSARRARDVRVDATVRGLGLGSVADQRVGDRSNRGISGGELRRLSVGAALLGDPQRPLRCHRRQIRVASDRPFRPWLYAPAAVSATPRPTGGASFPPHSLNRPPTVSSPPSPTRPPGASSSRTSLRRGSTRTRRSA